MSRSLSPPWILNYLLDVAATQGGDLIRAPFFTKNKKVQLTKFLTHQVPNENTWVWAQVSDMAYTIPVRLSRTAIEAYTRDPQFGSTPVHQRKTAFITMTKFRPMLSRVPLGPAKQGMSTKAHIVLEVDAFEIIGAFGEDAWGKPVDMEFNQDIKLWVEGMREGGGNGNILKLRRLEEEKVSAQANSEPQGSRSTVLQTTIRQTFRPIQPQTNIKINRDLGTYMVPDVRVSKHPGPRTVPQTDREAKFFLAVPPNSKLLEVLSKAGIVSIDADYLHIDHCIRIFGPKTPD
ncbi:hypothetical protein BDY19DRAFT_920900 [Irpex rosettiformis]|uniref:Uncharacterized protein n=1 Tax=Irpex rosettiformis TaxID=378272 RepID=A0ACB8UF61_9APHY|nr:hypothetical protein BDY19DRAFT_920900 [Irpex rosettiformis]